MDLGTIKLEIYRVEVIGTKRPQHTYGERRWFDTLEPEFRVHEQSKKAGSHKT